MLMEGISLLLLQLGEIEVFDWTCAALSAAKSVKFCSTKSFSISLAKLWRLAIRVSNLASDTIESFLSILPVQTSRMDLISASDRLPSVAVSLGAEAVGGGWWPRAAGGWLFSLDRLDDWSGYRLCK